MSNFEALLAALGYGPDDRIVISSDAGGQWHSTVCRDVEHAVEVVEKKAIDGNVYFTVQPVRVVAVGRGRAGDAEALVALYADLDFKPGGMGDRAKAEALIDRLAAVLGSPPAAVVASGGGLQPYWPVERITDMEAAAVLMLRWRALVEREAAALGGSVDNVFDLARVLRVPGTTNRKAAYETPAPVTLALTPPDEWGRLDGLDNLFSDAGIPTPTRTPSAATGADAASLAMVNGWLTKGAACRAAYDYCAAWMRAKDGDLHNSTLDVVGKLLRAGEQGHHGIDAALGFVKEQFIVSALAGGSSGSPRSPEVAHDEWRRMFRPEFLALMLTSPTPSADRGCCGAAAADDTVPDDVDPETGEIIPSRYRYVNWDALFAGEEKEIDWLIPGFLPRGKAAALWSPPAAGKSLLMLEWAWRLATGRSILGRTLEPMPVLYIDLEQDESILEDRLRSMGQVDGEGLGLLHYSLLGDWPFLDTEAGGNAVVEEALRLRAGLVVVDTISRAVDGKEDEADTYLALYRMTVLRLKRAGIAFVRLDHPGKDVKKGMRGSSAKSGDVDLIYRLMPKAEQADGSRLVELSRAEAAQGKDRLRLPGPATLRLLRQPGPPMVHVDADGDIIHAPKVVDVIAYVQAHPGCSRDDVCSAVKGRRATVLDAIRVALDHGLIEERDRHLFSSGGVLL